MSTEQPIKNLFANDCTVATTMPMPQIPTTKMEVTTKATMATMMTIMTMDTTIMELPASNTKVNDLAVGVMTLKRILRPFPTSQ